MSNTGNTYSEEFRRDAVALLLNSGRPICQVARELGVSVNSLRAWRNRFLRQSDADCMRELLRKQRKETELQKRRREILKKTARILSDYPQLGTS